MTIVGTALLALLMQNISIQGTVVRSGGSDPLSKAQVKLQSESDSVLDTFVTAEDGRFGFANIRPGRYQLSATRQGYVRPPLRITVAAGQPVVNVQLPMTPSAAIYGRVFKANGEPFGNIEVQALRAAYPDGRRTLVLAQSVTTNDLGEYRLFWLPPGRYYVAAIHPQAQNPNRVFMGIGMSLTMGNRGPQYAFAASGDRDPALPNPLAETNPREERAESYLPVFYPGTILESMASAIDLRAGADFGGVNIMITPVMPRHVRGVVVEGASGRTPEFASIREAPGMPGFHNEEFEVGANTGVFDVTLLPGSRTLIANSANGSATATVEIGDADVNNVTMVAWPSLSLRGRIRIDGANIDPKVLGRLQISLSRDPAPPPKSVPSGGFSNPLTDGSFAVEAGFGDFRINVAPLMNPALSFGIDLPPPLKDAFVKSVRLGNVDVLNSGIRIERPTDVALEIVIGTHPGAIDGVVADAGRSAGDVTVVLMPDTRRRVDLYRSVITDSAGRFQFDRIPPGNYKILAWRDVENGAWFDADFMREYEMRATALRVREGNTERLQIPLIP